MQMSFISSIKDPTYEHYIKKAMSMFKIKLNQILTRKTNLVYSLKLNTSHPIIRINAHIPQIVPK